MESDHKPLVPLLNTKHLDVLPPRVLRFRLRLARFDYTVVHVPGKLLYTADTLSRAPLPETGDAAQLEEVETFVENITQLSLPATPTRTDEYRKAQEQDEVTAQVRQYCSTEWPQEKFIPHELMPYWKARNDLTVCHNLLLYCNRIVVPKALQRETLAKVHSGHQGIERCRARVKVSVWWPGVNKSITQMVQQCEVCAKDAAKKREPLIVTPLPDYPWQLVGVDLFELDNTQYLLAVDYFSKSLGSSLAPTDSSI